jgi:PAS domain S-box-containing protein
LPATPGLREADDLADALRTAARQRQAATDELRTFFDISPVGIVRTDPAGHILGANPAFLRLAGLSENEVPVGDLRWDSLIALASESGRNTAAEEIRRRGYCDACEGGLLRPDGTRVPVVVAIALLDRQTGHTARFAMDLGRAKRAEAALLVSEAQARAQLAELAFIYDTAPVGLCVLDRGLHIVRVNERLAEMSGLPAADHLGRTVREIVPGLADQAEALAQHILDTGEPALNVEFNGETPAQPGVIRTWIEHWLPQRDPGGRIERINVVVEEITERKRIETSLAESEARLRLSQEAAGLGAWDWNPLTGALHWTPQQYRLLGLDPAIAGPPSFAMWLSVVHPDDRPTVEAIGMAAPASTAPFRAEFRIIPPGTATERWIHGMGETIRDSAGNLVRILGVNMDITERRRTEDDLRLLAETLEERVRQEVAARQQTQMQLVQSQRMEALGKLAGGIAHDFNNVLQAVLGGLEFIQRRSGDRQAVERFAELCSDAAKRGSAITNRLLTFARSGTLEARPIAPRPLLIGLKEILGTLLGPGVAVVIEADPDLPPLLADRDQLETALVNLASNARDAMPDGGTLRLSAQSQTEAEPGARPAGAFIQLDVSDTGIGMDADTLARATEPFYTTKPVGKGTGLGLSMARGFAEQSGGRFAISSTPGHGTTVSLWLPCAEPAAERTEKSGLTGSRVAASCGQVLLVDDDPMVAAVLAAQLQATGYTVRSVSDAAAALADIEHDTPDLLLTDFAMPGMNGLALIQEARRHHSGLPAILLTGYADAAVQFAALRREQHMTRVMRKPVRGDELAAVITELLDARNDASQHGALGV